MVKNRLPMQEIYKILVQSLGWEDPLEEGISTPVLPGESTWTESLVGCGP